MSQPIQLPDALYQELENIANRYQRPIEEMVIEALADYVSQYEEDDEATIRKAFLEGWHEVMTNAPARSIWDILAEIDDDPEA